ncbi:hypothetical protein [Lentzea sp. NPDC060358]|uniref:hypothetical protein n=1 Tax=Lentzea sp. NPDC060358 TaxID=3347103 RepID=UPI003649DF2E
MSIVAAVLLVASILFALAAFVGMVQRKDPFYGVVGLVTLCVPSSMLAFAYLVVA